MSKNQQFQKISPERYIRENARKLPIYKCHINQGWEETKICNVFVARQHPNGDITIGGYMVDLNCSGIKDSMYHKRISKSEYEEIIQEFEDYIDLDEISYALAHNIIYSGHDFAMDLNIKPCKEFVEVTKYILQEDDDSIELIEIECGEDFVPMVLRGPDNYQEATRLIHHLNKEIGPGNFIVHEIDEDAEDEDPDEEMDELLEEMTHFDSLEEIESYYYQNPVLERHHDIKTLQQYRQHIEDKNNDNEPVVTSEIKRLFYNSFDKEEFRKTVQKIKAFLNVRVDASVFKQYVGVDEQKWQSLSPDFKELIMDAACMEDKELKKLIQEYPDIPVFKFFLLLITENPDKKLKLTRQFMTLHPRYDLFRIILDEEQLQKNKKSQLLTPAFLENSTIGSLFQNREVLHPDEVTSVIQLMFQYFVSFDDHLSIAALNVVIGQFTNEYPMDFTNIAWMNHLFMVHYCINKYDTNQ